MAKFKNEGRIGEINVAVVTLTGTPTGSGIKVVTFEQSYAATPAILVVGSSLDSGTYTATSTSKTGFTVNVSTSDITGQDVGVFWAAHEKGVRA